MGLCSGGFQAAICLLVPFQLIQAITACPNLPAASPLRRKKLASKVGTALERKLHGELDPPRPAAAQERVADAHVAGGHNGISASTRLPVATHSETSDTRIGNESRKEGIREVGVVQNVKELSAYLHVQSFGDRRVLVYGADHGDGFELR